MDKKFLGQLQAYLDKPEEERDLMVGSTMLLQLNRNRILHQNMARNPQKYAQRLFYELGKYLKIHSDNMTIDGIVEMEKLVPGIESSTLEQIRVVTDGEGTIALGKRADHVELPDSIKALWVQNGELARLMKSLHEKLKLMSDMPPCDRYESLKQLLDTDKRYRDNWAQYDAYTKHLKSPEDVSGKVLTIDANRISANRKVLSLNKGKLTKLKESGDLPKYHALLEKTQERYDELKQAGCNLGENQMAELIAVGLKP